MSQVTSQFTFSEVSVAARGPKKLQGWSSPSIETTKPAHSVPIGDSEIPSDQQFKAMLKLYKTKTYSFARWFIEKAQSYNVAMPSSLRNIAAPYETETRFEMDANEWLPLAKELVRYSRSSLKVPWTVSKLLTEIVQLRLKYADCLAMRPLDAEAKEQDRRHRYFIAVLERVKEVFENPEAATVVQNPPNEPCSNQGITSRKRKGSGHDWTADSHKKTITRPVQPVRNLNTTWRRSEPLKTETAPAYSTTTTWRKAVANTCSASMSAARKSNEDSKIDKCSALAKKPANYAAALSQAMV